MAAAIVPRHCNFGGLGGHLNWGHHGPLHGCWFKKVAVVVAVGFSVHAGARLIQKFLRNRRQKQYKRDTVILHVFPRAKTVPSMSPYCLKLETYLRVAKIPFEVDMVDPMGPLYKSPWISYNEESIPDSTLCIDYLNKKFDINLNAKLNPSQRAIARSLQVMAEERMIWGFAFQRYVYEPTGAFLQQMNFARFIPNFLFRPIIRKIITKRALAQGLGVHSKEDILNFTKGDFKALSDYLGNKDFFFGPELTEVDCALFGILAMAVWTRPGQPIDDWFKGEFLNLTNYCIRVRALVWPDWDDHLIKTNA